MIVECNSLYNRNAKVNIIRNDDSWSYFEWILFLRQQLVMSEYTGQDWKTPMLMSLEEIRPGLRGNINL